MSDTKEIIEYVRGCINGVQKVTFGKDTVKSLLNALEQAEASAEKAEAMVARLQQRVNELLSEELTDGAVRERIKLRLNMHEVLQQNERLTKMVDWLANQLYCPSEFTNCAVDCAECRKEAASRAVADSEVNG